jgi:ubiquinone/menaquinone biosynthesis C-methylase UbiE
MTETSRASQYALGSTDAEHERLMRQAARLAQSTERFFRDAGIGLGQRILDIGSGVGDVAMLAARLVGPSGEVIGIERDMRSIARARARVAEAGLRNVSFMQSDVNQISGDKPFDAAVGRLILMYLPDPVAVLRSLHKLLCPGGVFSFSGAVLGLFSGACRALTSLVRVYFFNSRDLPTLWRKHRGWTQSLRDIPGSRVAFTKHAYGNAARRRSRMDLRRPLQFASENGAA